MKNLIISNCLMLISLFVMVSCSNKIDNLTPPQASISGALLNKVTKDTVQTSNNTSGYSFPDGVLNIFHQNYSTTNAGPQGTSYTQYGTFHNTSIFNGNYKAFPVGPFYADTVTFSVSDHTKLDFEVIPFLNVTIKIDVKTSNSITVTYNATTNDPLQHVNEVGVWLSKSEGVNRFSWLGSVYNPVDQTSYRAHHGNLNGDATFSKTFNNLEPGETYYLRAGAKSAGNNPQGYWNYSKLLKIKL
jgi:hypothetical protein